MNRIQWLIFIGILAILLAGMCICMTGCKVINVEVEQADITLMP